MNKEREVLCIVDQDINDSIFESYNMKNALEDLAIVIANNNEQLKNDSDLYKRLIDDYARYRLKVENFWEPFLIEYKDKITPDKELSLDFRSSELFLREIKNKSIIKVADNIL